MDYCIDVHDIEDVVKPHVGGYVIRVLLSRATATGLKMQLNLHVID